MTTDHQVIVIGSGLGSLVTAVTLQRYGYDVTVIERQHQCGGCMQSFQRAGYQWDTGLHYVGALDHGQTLGEIFRTLGLMDLPWQRLDADAFDRIYMPAGQYTFSCGYEQFADNLARQFPHQREALHSYVQTLQDLAQIHGLDTPHTTTATPPTSALEALSRGAWPYLEETFQDPMLRQVVSAAAMRLELHRDTLPLFTFAHNNAGFIQSAWRLAAPGRSLVDHLLHTLQQAGGHILRDLAVTTITEDQGHVSGCITSDGRHHHAPIVVSGIHPALTAEMAATCPSIRPSFRRRLTRLDNTAGMITVQLLLHPQRIPYFNHNKYVYTHNDVWDLDTATDRRGILITCRPADVHASEDNQSADVHASEHNIFADTLASEHNPSLEASAPYTRQIDILSPMAWDRVAEWADTTVGHRPESYRRFKECEAQTLIDLAATVIPGLREAIAAIYVSTPLTYRDYNLTPHGSAFGIRKDYHAPLLAALSATTPLPGLYLNGQSLMIHGVEGTTITAIRTAQQIMRDIE